jgi:two-component system response regulator YesN
VFGYITKPFNNNEIVETVMNATAALEEENRYKNEVKKNMQVIKEKYLADLMLYGKLDDQDTGMQLVNSNNSYFQVAVFYVQYLYNDIDSASEKLIEKEVAFYMAIKQVRDYIQKKENLGMFFQSNRITVLFEYETRSENSIQQSIEEIMNLLASNINAYIICGIGSVHQGVDRIPYTYEEAGKVIENRYEYRNQSIIYYKEMKKYSIEHFLQFKVLSDAIQEAIKRRDSIELRKQLENLLQSIANIPQKNDFSLGFMLMELLLSSYKASEDENLYQSFFKNSGALLNDILKAKNLSEISKIVWGYFDIMFIYLEESNTSETERMVQKALDYIKRNYSIPDLVFKDVADEVHLSTSYLSVLMKKYGNINYNQYLNEVRIENAKKLLASPDVKSYEVAFRAGFNSSQYFSSSFKKIVGVTPKDYKENLITR